VDGVDAGRAGHLEDLVDVEVGLGGRGGAEQVGLVGQAHVRGVTVHLAVDGDAAHAELTAGANHPDRDLSAVGDQHGVEHGGYLGASVWEGVPSLVSRSSSLVIGAPAASRLARRADTGNTRAPRPLGPGHIPLPFQ
jgi:hypothetical protein